ncbi:MAG: TetR family transcriptional regulator [Nocardioides sp.]|nr:TetR family transcriptional regulator [Nocardioides sp.]
MAVQSGVYRGVSAAERAAERRSRLLDAALAVWADPGTRTTMTAVCAEAGLTERYFYESFRHLDDVLLAVLEQVADEIEETTTAAREAAGDDPGARVRATMTTFVDLLVEDPRKARVAIIEAGAMPSLRARRTELLRHFAHACAEEAGGLEGLPHRGAAADEVAGLMFVGGLAELVTAWLDSAVATSPEELVEAATRSFLALYG